MTDSVLVHPTEQDAIRLQIDESRASLAEKIELLEEKVAETVQSATNSVAEATASVVDTVNNATASVSDTVESVNAAVQGTVANVRHTLSDTVESVRDTFDLSGQTRKHPWWMLAGAVVAGYVGGRYVLNGASSNSGNPHEREMSYESWKRLNDRFDGGSMASVMSARPDEYSAARSPVKTSKSNHAPVAPGWTSYLSDTFGAEITKLQGLAIGASLGLMRDMVTDSAPPAFRDQITEVINGLTEKLGGHLIESPLIPSATASEVSNREFS